MVLAYHLIISAYGFWLPNDPRGSWSDFIRSYELFLAGGPATKTDSRSSVAGSAHDVKAREAAKAALKYPPVRYSGLQAQAIGVGCGKAVAEYGYTIHAAAILPDHAHFVVARHGRTIEQIRDHLKSRATRELNDRGLNPMSRYPKNPSPWARKGWHVFLNSADDIERAIRYVRMNPVKAGLPQQRWSWVRDLYG